MIFDNVTMSSDLPIFSAIVQGNYQFVQEYIERGGDLIVNIQVRVEESVDTQPLHLLDLACHYNQKDMIKHLVERGKVSDKLISGELLMAVLLLSDHTDMLKYLVTLKAKDTFVIPRSTILSILNEAMLNDRFENLLVLIDNLDSETAEIAQRILNQYVANHFFTIEAKHIILLFNKTIGNTIRTY